MGDEIHYTGPFRLLTQASLVEMAQRVAEHKAHEEALKHKKKEREKRKHDVSSGEGHEEVEVVEEDHDEEEAKVDLFANYSREQFAIYPIGKPVCMGMLV